MVIAAPLSYAACSLASKISLVTFKKRTDSLAKRRASAKLAGLAPGR